MKSIDINCDMGESFGIYKLGMDEEVIKYITSANIACGFHAGDPQVIDKTVKLAKNNDVKVGAHPGFNDLEGFGRRKINISADQLINELIYQISAVKGFCETNGIKLSHIKPHGALNNMASVDEKLAKAIAEAIKLVDSELIYITLAGSKMEKIGEEEGLIIAREAFADRAYNDDGTLVPRNEPGAVLHNSRKIVDRVINMANNGSVETKEGNNLTINPDTICVHGDNPEAVKLVAEIKSALGQNNINLAALEEIIKKR